MKTLSRRDSLIGARVPRQSHAGLLTMSDRAQALRRRHRPRQLPGHLEIEEPEVDVRRRIARIQVDRCLKRLLGTLSPPRIAAGGPEKILRPGVPGIRREQTAMCRRPRSCGQQERARPRGNRALSARSGYSATNQSLRGPSRLRSPASAKIDASCSAGPGLRGSRRRACDAAAMAASNAPRAASTRDCSTRTPRYCAALLPRKPPAMLRLPPVCERPRRRRTRRAAPRHRCDRAQRRGGSCRSGAVGFGLQLHRAAGRPGSRIGGTQYRAHRVGERCLGRQRPDRRGIRARRPCAIDGSAAR